MENRNLQETDVRVIKIGAEAIFELLYESINGELEQLFKVAPCSCSSSFYLDWESRQFICCVHKSEDNDGNFFSLPNEISLETLITVLPNTADSILSSDPRPLYRQFTKDKLVELYKSDIKI